MKNCKGKQMNRTEQNRITTVHCLFEQSGTFKNEFIKLGIKAFDYDILNNYNQTDFQLNLFDEIDKAYNGSSSIFDNFKPTDLIMVFFPCVRFENQIMLAFRGQSHGMEKWDFKRKMMHCMKLLDELKQNYDLVNKMFIICMDKHLRLIMENPFSEEHFLRRYWCFPATIIDKDRRKNGDWFKKPTQFWFLNIKPLNNILSETANDNSIKATGKGKDEWEKRTGKDLYKTGAKSIKEARSMIHPEYANRFIRQYLINDPCYNCGFDCDPEDKEQCKEYKKWIKVNGE